MHRSLRLTLTRMTALAGLLTPGISGIVGCGGEAPAEDESAWTNLNLAPADLQEAQKTLAQMDALLEADPADTDLLAMAHELRRNVEQLSGLVDRIELGSKHYVNFYFVEGIAVVGEYMPTGTEPVLAALADLKDINDIYARLAPGRAVPDVLDGAPFESAQQQGRADTPEDTHSAADVGTESGGGIPFSELANPAARPNRGVVGSAELALTAADGPFFRDNLCPTGGHLVGCLPNWANGGFAGTTARRTDLVIAPFTGGFLNVHISSLGVLRQILPVFSGEVSSFAWQGRNVDVPTRDCCFICACPTERLPQKIHMRWDIMEASGDGFHWGFRFTNLGNSRDP